MSTRVARRLSTAASALLAACLTAGCSGGVPESDRQVDLHASTEPRDTVFEALLQKHAQLLDGIRRLDHDQLTLLLTSDFIMQDHRGSSSIDGSPDDPNPSDSISYFMLLGGQHSVALPSADAVHQPCRIDGNSRVVLIRLGPADWAASTWRDESGDWRTERLMLMSTPPSGEPPVRGAVCGTPGG
jgi:hypothetical protein